MFAEPIEFDISEDELPQSGLPYIKKDDLIGRAFLILAAGTRPGSFDANKVDAVLDLQLEDELDEYGEDATVWRYTPSGTRIVNQTKALIKKGQFPVRATLIEDASATYSYERWGRFPVILAPATAENLQTPFAPTPVKQRTPERPQASRPLPRRQAATTEQPATPPASSATRSRPKSYAPPRP